MPGTAAEAPPAEVALPPAGAAAAVAAGDAAIWAAPVVAAPTWHAGGAAVAADATGPGRQLELARACLDRGDDDAARGLLREVLDSRDPSARAEAARMLREL
jgi:FimV-like protein